MKKKILMILFCLGIVLTSLSAKDFCDESTRIEKVFGGEYIVMRAYKTVIVYERGAIFSDLREVDRTECFTEEGAKDCYKRKVSLYRTLNF